jgi:ferredoxin-fold anticodon binding domain-containing protein
MTESEIQKSIMDYAKAIGCKVFRMNSGYSGRHNVKLCPNGTPDLLIIGRSITLWVEVKDKKGKLSESQIKMHKELRELGQEVLIARSIDDVKIYFREV